MPFHGFCYSGKYVGKYYIFLKRNFFLMYTLIVAEFFLITLVIFLDYEYVLYH